jgi:YD repeat-containing protein
VTRLGKTLTYQYNAAGLRTGATFPNGITASYSYDDANRLTQIQYLQGPTPVLTVSYTYNAVGNCISQTLTDGSGTQNYEYSYDNLDRLTEVKLNGVVQTTYTYDAVGNRLSKTMGGQTTSYSYNSRDQMLTARRRVLQLRCGREPDLQDLGRSDHHVRLGCGRTPYPGHAPLRTRGLLCLQRGRAEGAQDRGADHHGLCVGRLRCPE